MTIREAKRAERQTMKDKSFKEKFNYWLDYNGLKALAIAFVAILLLTGIYQMITRKETAFRSVFINANASTESYDYMDNFGREMGIDLGEFQVLGDTSMQIGTGVENQMSGINSVELFAAQYLSKEIDTVVAPGDVFTMFAYQDCMIDLREVYSEEQLSVLKPYLYYLDTKTLEKYTEQSLSHDGITIQLPNGRNPEAMEDPIPVGIFLDDATEEFYKLFHFTERDIVIGIAANSEHMDYAAAFPFYLLGLNP